MSGNRKREQQLRVIKQIIVIGVIVIICFVGVLKALKPHPDKIEEIIVEKETVVQPIEEPAAQQVSMVAVGDNLLHMAVIESGIQADDSLYYDRIYDGIKAEIAAADIAVINQETILGGEALTYSGYPNFNSPQEMGDTLSRLGFNVVLHATNHALDVGFEGVANTMDFWQTTYPDIMALGLNQDEMAQEEIAIIEVNDIKVAVLNYTYDVNDEALPEGMSYLVNLLDEEMVIRHIKKARENADVVIVFPHWGTEYSHKIDEEQKHWVKLFADQGVDAVIGTHPHVIQPIEWVERPDQGQMLVAYSLGNILSKQKQTPCMLGGMAQLTIEKNDDGIAVVEGEIIPTVTHYNHDATEFSIYKLSDYTEELAQQHGILAEDDSYSLKCLTDLAQQTFGDFS